MTRVDIHLFLVLGIMCMVDIVMNNHKIRCLVMRERMMGYDIAY